MMVARIDFTHNSAARRLKSYAHQRKTTGSSSFSFQLRFFSKWQLLLKERIMHVRNCVMGATPMTYNCKT